MGAGNMGTAMMKRLVAVGFGVTAYDVRAELRGQIETAGARAATSLDDLGAAPVVAIVVLDDDQVLDVARGLIPVLARGATIVIHSTVLPETVRAVAAEAAGAGIAVVDAPVTGASWAAERGELVLLVGGADDAVAACRHELDALGSVRRLGPLGSGEAMKIVNNMMQLGHYALAHEGLKLADALGIDVEVARAVALEGSGSSWTLANLDRLDALNAAPGNTRASWLGKDTWLAQHLAHDARVRVPVAALVYQLIHGYVAERVSARAAAPDTPAASSAPSPAPSPPARGR